MIIARTGLECYELGLVAGPGPTEILVVREIIAMLF